MIISGKSALKGNTVNSYGDHRIGMMLAIAGRRKTIIEDAEAVGVSYPTFFDELQKLAKWVESRYVMYLLLLKRPCNFTYRTIIVRIMIQFKREWRRII